MRAAPGQVLPSTCSPFSLQVDEVARMLNFELPDHPVYDFAELQWFDDERHGSGMLAFLSRRGTRRVDYYAEPGLHIDRAGYHLGGGTGRWNEVAFERACLEVHLDGVVADARFTDVDGRVVEIHVDDRDGRPRRPGGLLAPVSADIEHPESLLLVWMPQFDLVRRGGVPPVLRIDGQEVAPGRLPGGPLLRRRLIKYGPLVTVEVNRAHEGALPSDPPGDRSREDQVPSGELVATGPGHRARMVSSPPLVDLASLGEDEQAVGRWYVEIDRTRLTGGRWEVRRHGDTVEAALDVDEPWRPSDPPWPMRLVTRLVPAFRRWPTTYRWRAEIHLGDDPTMSSRWERTEGARGIAYQGAANT